MTASAIIKKILEEKEISQVELAKMMNMSRQNLNNKLSRDNFTIKELSNISKVLDVSLIIKDKAGNEQIISYSD